MTVCPVPGSGVDHRATFLPVHVDESSLGPVFPLRGFVCARDVQPDDYLHLGDVGLRVRVAVTYDNDVTLIEGTGMAGLAYSAYHPGGSEVEVTRLVDENLERA